MPFFSHRFLSVSSSLSFSVRLQRRGQSLPHRSTPFFAPLPRCPVAPRRSAQIGVDRPLLLFSLFLSLSLSARSPTTEKRGPVAVAGVFAALRLPRQITRAAPIISSNVSPALGLRSRRRSVPGRPVAGWSARCPRARSALLRCSLCSVRTVCLLGHPPSPLLVHWGVVSCCLPCGLVVVPIEQQGPSTLQQGTEDTSQGSHRQSYRTLLEPDLSTLSLSLHFFQRSPLHDRPIRHPQASTSLHLYDLAEKEAPTRHTFSVYSSIPTPSQITSTPRNVSFQILQGFGCGNLRRQGDTPQPEQTNALFPVHHPTQ